MKVSIKVKKLFPVVCCNAWQGCSWKLGQLFQSLNSMPAKMAKNIIMVTAHR